MLQVTSEALIVNGAYEEQLELLGLKDPCCCSVCAQDSENKQGRGQGRQGIVACDSDSPRE